MKIQIFDVEHGACALLTADTGARMLIDCGHNSTTNWRPSSYLKNMGVNQLQKLAITNYDEDHASDLANLLQVVSVDVLVSNPSVSALDLRKLKNIGGIGAGIEALADMKSRYTQSISNEPNFGAISFKSFWNVYPTEFEDENNLSMVLFIKVYGLSICFPGDMEIEGWKNLLRKAEFGDYISSVNVFVASHHGRQNGCCDELYSIGRLNPEATIISDSGVQYATQETIGWYRNRTRGFNLNGEFRRVLTTRRDGRILIEATPQGTTIATGV
jgi:beta-lactamase superfamily II metal-dependent hydrolase